MMKQLATWKLISQSLHKQVAVMLLYVVESIGSSPGRKDFFMAVNITGEMEGSLGGGIMEHKFVEMAKAKLSANTAEASIHQQIHDKSVGKNQSGMICSGEQTIFLYRVQPGDLQSIDEIISTLENLQTGILKLSNQGISFSVVGNRVYDFIKSADNSWKYKTRIGYTNHVYIIGGGHCALALSHVMHSLNFYIHVYDDREDLHTIQLNHYAHETKVLDDYSALQELITDGDKYVVIMTHGYRTDDVALRCLLNKNVTYLGVLGSKHKIEKMFLQYKSEGISDTLLNRIHAPIGIEIASKTPEEIAVSIAAEIIKVKNNCG